MILQSLSKSTAHPARHARTLGGFVRGGIDWTRVEEVYSFARSRARERVREAEQSDDDASISSARAALHTLGSMYKLARRSDDLAACAITYFRVRAMRDAQHPDFRGEWLGSPLTYASAG
jgi:hypothetical protein